MKQMRKIQMLLMSMVCSLLLMMGAYSVPMDQVQAASIKISAKSVSLKVGSTKTLKLKNTKKKPTWKSSNTKVATVNGNGKVKAVGKGTVTITASLGTKNYTCKVTVRELTSAEKLTKVHKAVKSAYKDNYRPNMTYDSLYLKEVIGLDTNCYDAVIAEGPMMSAAVDTFIGVHAKSGKVAEVEKALKAYQSYLINDTFQYPLNQPKINASKVVTKGEFVFFILLGSNNDNELDEGKLLSYYKAQNEIAVNAINNALAN